MTQSNKKSIFHPSGALASALIREEILITFDDLCSELPKNMNLEEVLQYWMETLHDLEKLKRNLLLHKLPEFEASKINDCVKVKDEDYNRSLSDTGAPSHNHSTNKKEK